VEWTKRVRSSKVFLGNAGKSRRGRLEEIGKKPKNFGERNFGRRRWRVRMKRKSTGSRESSGKGGKCTTSTKVHL